jgi:predicted ArsR family transcriptional regulator
MLHAIRRTFGDQGLDRLTEERTRQQIQGYLAQMPGPDASLKKRVAALAHLRRKEGYMAEWRGDRDGTLWLVENHCSIARAATLCPSLCGSELSLFRALLGDNVAVERVEHLLSGDRRCAYRITERSGEPAVRETSSSSP